MKKKIKNKRFLFLFSFFVCSIVNSQEIKILKDSILINSDYFNVSRFIYHKLLMLLRHGQKVYR